MAWVSILVLMVNLVFIQGRTDVANVGPDPESRAETHFDVYASAIAKAHYNPWFCNYFKEPGYKCNDCSTALHCFPGNFALLIQCAGRLPYCNNGYCSAVRARSCQEDSIKSSSIDSSKLGSIELDNPQEETATVKKEVN